VPLPLPASLRRLPLLLALAILASACGGPQARELSYGERARRNYENAYEAFENGDCLTAEPLFRRIRRESPYSRYAALAELRIADCLQQQAQWVQAIRAYRSFVRGRPAHPEVPYAEFKVAESYFRQIPSGFFLSPPPFERDQTATRNALRELRTFINEHRDSEHIEDALEMLEQALDLLARHELYVADFYRSRGQPQAAVFRLRYLLETYEGSGIEPEALLLLGRTYLTMRETRDARRTFQEIVDRFPESGYATQAESYLSRFER
jgi:outer membrane protein assembly factor BamD